MTHDLSRPAKGQTHPGKVIDPNVVSGRICPFRCQVVLVPDPTGKPIPQAVEATMPCRRDCGLFLLKSDSCVLLELGSLAVEQARRGASEAKESALPLQGGGTS